MSVRTALAVSAVLAAMLAAAATYASVRRLVAVIITAAMCLLVSIIAVSDSRQLPASRLPAAPYIVNQGRITQCAQCARAQ